MEKPNFSLVLQALQDSDQAFPPRYLYRFSDLAPTDLRALLDIWPQVSLQRRRALLEDLEVLAESDPVLSFDELAAALLTDPDSVTRMLAIRLLWQSEDVRLVPRFLHILAEDDDYFTRAAAASGLGPFLYLGELEELESTLLTAIEEGLLAACTRDAQKLVRRRALESLGYSSRPEVPGLIAEAADRQQDVEWLASALFAMGRSAHPARWGDQVLAHLEHYDAQVRMEAVRAAGELGLTQARQPLLRLLTDEDDRDVRDAIIWALSQIGGGAVRRTLEALYDQLEADSEDEPLLRDALDNLDFTEDVLHFEMFSVNPEDQTMRSFDPATEEDENFGPSWEEDWLSGGAATAEDKDKTA